MHAARDRRAGPQAEAAVAGKALVKRNRFALDGGHQVGQPGQARTRLVTAIPPPFAIRAGACSPPEATARRNRAGDLTACTCSYHDAWYMHSILGAFRFQSSVASEPHSGTRSLGCVLHA
jgi:hypothetical protein